MLYMNHYEVAQARERYATHPILGPATATLTGLVQAVDSCSDGWPYWSAPVRAAARLMTLIGTTRQYLQDSDRGDVTEAQLRAAYVPLKAFGTRKGVCFEIHTVKESSAELGREVRYATR